MLIAFWAMALLTLSLTFAPTAVALVRSSSQHRIKKQLPPSHRSIEDLTACSEITKPLPRTQLASKLKFAIPAILVLTVVGGNFYAASAATGVAPTLNPTIFINNLAGNWRYFLAGAICCAFSHAVTVPCKCTFFLFPSVSICLCLSLKPYPPTHLRTHLHPPAIVLTKVDVVKTRIQTNPNGDNSPLTILREEGLSALFAGSTPSIVGYGLGGSQKYGFYESFKPLVADYLQQFNVDDGAFAWLAGSTVSFIVAGAMVRACACAC